MRISVDFHPKAEREWRKLDPEIRRRFERKLKLLIDDALEPEKLRPPLSGYFKLKLQGSGYRLVYTFLDKGEIFVLAVGRRDTAYLVALNR